MRRVHVRVEGTVQGVGFRYTLQQVAERAGVTGWVRNLRDGAVEAEIEGEDAAVGTVLDWMRRGPRGAAVTAIDLTDTPIVGGTRFEVRHDG